MTLESSPKRAGSTDMRLGICSQRGAIDLTLTGHLHRVDRNEVGDTRQGW